MSGKIKNNHIRISLPILLKKNWRGIREIYLSEDEAGSNSSETRTKINAYYFFAELKAKSRRRDIGTLILITLVFIF